MEEIMINEVVSYSNAYELLEDLKNKGQIAFIAPIDVDKVAYELGIVVEDDYFLDHDTVGIISFQNERPVVKINPFQNNYSPRRRFTLAHEIGHFCLHKSKKDGFIDSMHTMSRTESYWNPIESEANGFAAQLLMPHELILDEGQMIINEYTSRLNTNTIPAQYFIESMADKFVVSNKAMEYRLRNVGIIKNEF
jgi:Zn-dependent peptidase ImmA (M78 family)